MLRVAVFAILALCLPTACGCSFATWERVEELHDGPRVRVELEQRRFEGEVQPLGHAHPEVVAPLGLGLFFLELRHVEERLFLDDLDEPVVAAGLVGELSGAIASGLTRAGPDQRVRFRTSNPVTKLLLLPGGTVTRGVAFVDPPGMLNIAFDLVSDPASDDAERVPGWGDPTRRIISDVRLELPEGACFHTTPEGVPDSLWVMIPVEQLAILEEANPDGLPGAADESKDAPAEDEPAKGEPVAAEERPQATKPPPTDPKREPKPEPAAETPPKTDAEILQRLRFLEELYQDGAISEEAYKQQRSELLKKRE